MRERIAVFLVLAVAVSPLAAQQTPPADVPPVGSVFRGNVQRTGVYLTRGVHKIPTIKWKFKVGDKPRDAVWAPPIVAEGTVFVGSVDNRRGTPKYFHALEIETGKEKWRFTVDGKIDGRAMLGDIQGFPQYADGMVYFANEGRTLYALDARTGKEVWRRKAGAGDVTVIGPTAYYVGRNGIYAVDAKTGTQKWHHRLPRMGASTALAFDDDMIYFVNLDGTAYAFDLKARKVAWTQKTSGGVGGCPIIAAPAVADGVVYVGSSEQFVALDAKTGRAKWTFKTGQKFYCAPVVAEGTVYIANNRGQGGTFLFALDAATGTEKWKFKLASPAWAPPTAADGLIYCCGCSGDLHAVDMKTGEEKWKFKVQNHVSSPITVVDGVITFGNWKGWLFALQ